MDQGHLINPDGSEHVGISAPRDVLGNTNRILRRTNPRRRRRKVLESGHQRIKVEWHEWELLGEVKGERAANAYGSPAPVAFYGIKQKRVHGFLLRIHHHEKPPAGYQPTYLEITLDPTRGWLTIWQGTGVGSAKTWASTEDFVSNMQRMRHIMKKQARQARGEIQ